MIALPASLATLKAFPKRIDHIVYAVADLETGIDNMEHLLGVRPVPGGQHPDYGTHNALLSLGAKIYLEIIAPAPDLPVPNRGLAFGVSHNRKSRIVRWALRTNSIRKLAASVAALSIDIGSIESGRRANPDGTLLAWQLSNPYTMPLEGALPFLIDWGSTLHPASIAPHAGNLVRFRIEHPNAQSVRDALLVLGVDIEVQKAEKVRLVASIETEFGIVSLD